MSDDLEYMKWVTNNVKTLVVGKNNLVACVRCLQIYETTRLGRTPDNCLLCAKCGTDAVMVVKHSPLHELTKEQQDELLKKWNIYGFTPLPIK